MTRHTKRVKRHNKGPSARALRVEGWRDWARIILWSVGIAAPIIWICAIRPLRANQDTELAVPQSQRGVVVDVAINIVRTRSYTATVHMGNQDVIFTRYTPIAEGDHVLVRYRVGKSGNIYVDALDPDVPGSGTFPERPHFTAGGRL